MEERVDERFNVMEGRLEMMELAIDGMKAETGALRQDTIAIRQELKEIMRILGGRGQHQDDHQLEGSQASVNGGGQKQEEEDGYWNDLKEELKYLIVGMQKSQPECIKVNQSAEKSTRV
ncbi:hypothetical protein LR48_Vigan503s004600 [Vigna angularis]|uniref:Uncharacterized protein n=1 Tax=Phaseolus angularis TaxID=3914 RepID=A0A0L9TCR7_PHAAN|nr:hypothetical protein LR48_Vigan503s004600 [Vigna angularis]